MSTGSATNVGDKKESDLSAIIAELRTALGGIPEVAKVYGKPEGLPNAYDAFDLRGNIDEIKYAYDSPELEFNAEEESSDSETTERPKDAYSAPFNPDDAKEIDSLRADQPESAYSKVVLEEKESSESESKDSDIYIGDLKLNPEQPKAPIGKESESSDEAVYIDDLKDAKVSPAVQSAPDQSAPAIAADAAANYEKVRKETDHRLAKLAKFLPDNVREALDKKFDEAVKLAQPKSDEGYQAATEALTKLQGSLESKAPELRAKENTFLRKQVKSTLDGEGDTLEPDAKKAFVDRFAALDKDLPAEEAEAKTQLESLQKLAGELKSAIQDRLKAVSDLCVDYERLAPIVQRALSIKGDKHDDLEKANTEIKDGFAGQFVKDGLSVEEIRAKLSDLESKVREAFKDFTLDDAKEEQKKSLPASQGSLKPKGASLGSGAFGEVFELKNDGDKKLVGKSFSGDNLEAKKEMEHEAEIYARIGEHPNIAKCYGIHEVEGKSMLVMDKIEGEDVEKVFKDLHKRLKKGKISREEYLAATQHIIKGTLMGLAHMEATGLVHKDIKGDNVKFDTRTNQALLIDMGLAQPEGEHLNPKSYFLIAPPEQMAGRKDAHDKVVTNLWDSFTVGKLLFEEMEREADGEKNLLVTGDVPIKQDINMPSMQSLVQPIVQGSRAALKRGASGELEAQTDAKGQLVGQALKKADTPEEGGKAGKYGAMTQYVDFMNRLTHPDPKQRMSNTDALKHPFMTDTMLSGEELDKVFGVATTRQKPGDEDESDEESGEGSKGPRIDTNALAEDYKKNTSTFRAESLEDDEDEDDEDEDDEVGEEDTDVVKAREELELKRRGTIDTDALAEAYKKGEKKKYDSLLGEDSEDESDEEKGPRLDTDKLAALYSGKQSADDDLDSFEDEAEEKK
jgi:serine/threonine protein kinase